MKIYAPNKNYAGVTAGVSFAGGVGETIDPYLKDWFTEHGYEVEEETPKTTSRGRAKKQTDEDEESSE